MEKVTITLTFEMLIIMKEIINFIKIPDHLKEAIGHPDQGTRMYRQYGYEDIGTMKWWDTLMSISKDITFVSPGGAASYVGVSRAAVHKRMKEGRLTAFVFYTIEKKKFLNMDYEKLSESGEPSIIYIPWCELMDWRAYMDTRRDKKKARIEAVKGYKNDNFLKGNKKWKQIKKNK